MPANIDAPKENNQSHAGIIRFLPTIPYQLGTNPLAMDPVYLPGQAYLAARQGAPAAAEFQKVLNNLQLQFGVPIGSLAHLGLARAYLLEAQSAQGPDAQAARAKARAA